ncbi:MAG TPA: protein kinase [Chitinispirillaceae bacterium]|nr:protein kinase [Chitinispirillaceae bacterium]
MGSTESNKQAESSDKKNLRIHNLIANIERTFLPAGHVIGKYQIIREIDRGGMAIVYKALQLDLKREVALKVMPANITINRCFVERFLTEAHAVAKLSHPNIVSIHEVAREDNIYYLAMDYIPGENLYYYLHHRKPKLVDVLEIVSKLADALAYAHNQKIIHRDLKLNNVIMRDPLNPVLIDFGLAKTMEADDDTDALTRTGEIMGSPSYMAPERLLGGMIVDHRSDICSLGIMLYEMLTFKNPYIDHRNLHQTTINVMEANPIAPSKLVPWLPSEIEAITLKAMAKDLSLRYQSMEEFKADINRYQRGDLVLARPPSFLSKASRFFRINWAPVIISSLIFTFLAVFAFSIYNRSAKEQSHWQKTFEDSFDYNTKSINWAFFPDLNDTAWTLQNGSLRGNFNGFAFARLQQHFNRDMLIVCDIIADSNDLFNAGIFLFSDQPDSGYCFHLNNGGHGSHGMSYPGSSFLFRNPPQFIIPFSKVNHIEIERIENLITFTLNGKVISKVHDCFPPLGKGHDRIGFFINGSSVRFDNLKIYRRAIPLIPSPALIADRFRERGDIESALDEYRGLQLDSVPKELFKDIPLKEVDCLIRLHRYEEAYEVMQLKAVNIKDDRMAARRCFLEGMLFSSLGQNKEADSLFNLLALHYPTFPENSYIMSKKIIKCNTLLDNSMLDSAEHEIRKYIHQYSKYLIHWGKLHLDLVRKHISNRNFDKAQFLIQEILVSYKSYNEITAEARNLMGQMFLEKGQNTRAKEQFDQCVTAFPQTDAFWRGWFKLADIYDYEGYYKDALTIYKMLSRECPPNIPIAMMAAIRRAELIYQDSSEASLAQFNEVINSSHPFPLPRLIASFYTGKIDSKTFQSKWNTFCPDDPSYRYYLARKAIFIGDIKAAKNYLIELKKKSITGSWQFLKVSKLLNKKYWGKQ